MNTKVCVECKRNAKKDDITNENKGVNKERNMFKICNNYDNHNHSVSIVITLHWRLATGQVDLSLHVSSVQL